MAACRVKPTAATWGSVNTTPGGRGLGAVCRRCVSGQDLRDDVGLVLAHMSQERAAVDVADRIQPRVAGHLEVLIDGQRFPWREPDCLQVEISGQGLAARGPRPAATRISSPTTTLPSSSSAWTSPSLSRLTLSA